MSVSPVSPPRKNLPPEKPLLITEDIAPRMLGVSKPTFRSWVDAGLIARVDLPGNLRRNLYRRADLERFAASLAARK